MPQITSGLQYEWSAEKTNEPRHEISNYVICAILSEPLLVPWIFS